MPPASDDHETSRKPAQGHELADDRPGHEASDHSSEGNRYEPRNDVRRKEHQRFARKIAERLETGLAAGEFSSHLAIRLGPGSWVS